MRLTIATPAAHVDIANHYAMALGYSEADRLTYRTASWQDAAGNLYSAASLEVSDGFVGLAVRDLPRPDWDTESIIDRAKVAQSQQLVNLWIPNEEGTLPPLATKNKITAVLGMEGTDAMAAMGLTAINDEETL